MLDLFRLPKKPCILLTKECIKHGPILNRRTEILDLAHQFGMTNVRLFGSQARGTASPGGDTGLVVGVHPGPSLLDLLGFEAAMEALLGCPVDVVSERGLPPTIIREIERESTPL